MSAYSKFLGFGIAGNFALHLAQAGELEDFKNIITADEAAPKGMFPFYLPNIGHSNPNSILKEKQNLTTYPLSSSYIKKPKEDLNIQAEPEVGLVCEIQYAMGKVKDIIPIYFGAYNDCSIRVAGAKKISDKKNWGADSKGFSDKLFKIDKFKAGGIMDDFSIVSYLRRDGELHQYGEDVELNGYSYFYSKLTTWMVKQINEQDDFGPLEPISKYIDACHCPKEAVISIGATRYTEYGETTFLKENDEVIVVLYNRKHLTQDDVLKAIQEKHYDNENMSILSQKVI